MSFTEVTKPNRPWFLKMAIFTIVLLAFGAYGYYDATIAYPARGKSHSSYLLYQYLEAARTEGLSDVKVSIENPPAELKSLREQGGDKLSGAVRARFEWLNSLSIIHALKSEPIRFTGTDRETALAELKKLWTTGSTARSAPKPLSQYDILVQWIFTVLGVAGGLALLAHVARIMARKYKWDPEAKALQLPDGSTLTPADIEDFDKRKWDKFLIFLKIKPGHAKHGGKELKLDLYQHTPLESWVLEMERVAFPDREPPAAAAAPAPA